jgi:hypothetical protein
MGDNNYIRATSAFKCTRKLDCVHTDCSERNKDIETRLYDLLNTFVFPPSLDFVLPPWFSRRRMGIFFFVKEGLSLVDLLGPSVAFELTCAVARRLEITLLSSALRLHKYLSTL